MDAYLRPQTVVLRLSSEKVTDEEKAEMAAKMRGLESPEEYEEENVVITRTTRLPDLVSDQLWLVFSELGISGADWMALPVREWAGDGEYGKFESFSKGLKVTNDLAERGVKLLEDLVNSITHDEEQLQDLMLLVENHRKLLPRFTKSALSML